MEDFKKCIRETIANNRPSLGDSSMKTYCSILVNLHKKMNGSADDKVDWFSHNVEPIMIYLQDKPSRQRKSVLSALFVLTKSDEYRKLMIEDCKRVNDDYKNQKKDAREEENWIELPNIKEVYDGLLTKVKAMFSHRSIVDTAVIMEFLLVALLGGVAGLPPRRSLDYSLMKIKNYDTKTDNYYKAGVFYFNRYKTSAKYGLQTLRVSKELNSLLKKWIKMNDTDYLLFSSNKHPLSSSQISKLLNKIFKGRRISVDILRHVYLTHFYRDMPAFRDMETLANNMGHSVNQALLYAKKH